VRFSRRLRRCAPDRVRAGRSEDAGHGGGCTGATCAAAALRVGAGDDERVPPPLRTKVRFERQNPCRPGMRAAVGVPPASGAGRHPRYWSAWATRQPTWRAAGRWNVPRANGGILGRRPSRRRGLQRCHMEGSFRLGDQAGDRRGLGDVDGVAAGHFCCRSSVASSARPSAQTRGRRADCYAT
jgi:hypothetical protein